MNPLTELPGEGLDPARGLIDAGSVADQTVNSQKSKQGRARLPLPVKAADSPPPPVPHESVFAILARLPALPTADRTSWIAGEPEGDERQALEQLFQHLPRAVIEKEKQEIVLRAYQLASYAHRTQRRESGEPYILHPLAVTRILVDLHMDGDTLAAGLLHDVAEDSEFSIDYLREHFGATVALLVDGVTKLQRINEIGSVHAGTSDIKSESLRKMFLAMAEDIRVVLIKLADRLHNMRTLGGQKDHKRRRIARETVEIFAPLANRLGIWWIKSELEDLSFRYLEPANYKELQKAIQQKQDERDKLIIRVKGELERELVKAGIAAEISGRPKHIYSIWRKMQRKEVNFDQIYDAHGFRVIVENEAQCYAALGIVHSIWRPIPGEFDDYIASPKNNMYRSLHTAVLSRREGHPLEVQIRTREMHQIAECGIAAHWQYKEQSHHSVEFQNKIAWIRQLMDWRQEVTDAKDFVNGMKNDVFQDRVFVFTPKGEIVDLPAGATPIDLAYSVHTELGHRCRGASVNGRLVALDYKLSNGDQVSIIAAKQGGPSRDWLNPSLAYVATQRARSKIRGWLRKQGREENVQRGRQMLEKELKRLSVTLSMETVSKLFNLDKVEDFQAAIGYGDINSQQIAQKILEYERREVEKSATLNDLFTRQVSVQARTATEGLTVQGVEGLLTQLGRCCNPVPGDAIVGYVTKGRGVTVHRTACPNITAVLRRSRDNRLVDVQWSTVSDAVYPVKIYISAYDRAGLVRDVTGLIADERINMSSVEALTGQKDNLALINATLEIADVAQLMRILTKLERLPNIVDARRAVS